MLAASPESWLNVRFENPVQPYGPLERLVFEERLKIRWIWVLSPTFVDRNGNNVNPGNSSAVPNVEVEVPVEETPEEYAWMFHARCRGIDPAEFFPSDGTGVETAQRVCAACPVTVECLEYALLNRIEHGVWGGASERERRRILRRRRDVAAQQV
jgi:WhiB family transcriptional regulator, redox-sensing transcriptional regulator